MKFILFMLFILQQSPKIKTVSSIFGLFLGWVIIFQAVPLHISIDSIHVWPKSVCNRSKLIECIPQCCSDLFPLAWDLICSWWFRRSVSKITKISFLSIFWFFDGFYEINGSNDIHWVRFNNTFCGKKMRPRDRTGLQWHHVTSHDIR